MPCRCCCCSHGGLTLAPDTVIDGNHVIASAAVSGPAVSALSHHHEQPGEAGPPPSTTELLAALQGARGEASLLRALAAIRQAQRRGAVVAKPDLVAAGMAARGAAGDDSGWTPAVAAAFHDVLAASEGGAILI